MRPFYTEGSFHALVDDRVKQSKEGYRIRRISFPSIPDLQDII